MIHPSYQELIATINEGQDLDEAPVVSSRYSLVLATSKRARQIIGGAEPLVKVKKGMKPLSIMLVSTLALARYDERAHQKPAANAIEQTIDAHFPDARMEKIYPNAKAIN